MRFLGEWREQKRWSVGSCVMETATKGTRVHTFTTIAAGLIRRTERRRKADPITATTLKELLANKIVVKDVVGGSASVLAVRVRYSNRVRNLAIATSDGKGMGKCTFGPSIVLPTGGKGLSINKTLKRNIVAVVGSVKLGRPCSKRAVLRAKRVTRSLACCFTASRRMPSSIKLKILVGGSGAIGYTNKFVIRMVPFVRSRILGGLRTGVRGVRSMASVLSGKRAPRRVLGRILRKLSLRVAGAVPTRFCYGYSGGEVRGTVVDVKGGRVRRVVSRNGRVRIGYRFYGATCGCAMSRLGRLLGRTQWMLPKLLP